MLWVAAQEAKNADHSPSSGATWANSAHTLLGRERVGAEGRLGAALVARTAAPARRPASLACAKRLVGVPACLACSSPEAACSSKLAAELARPYERYAAGAGRTVDSGVCCAGARFCGAGLTVAVFIAEAPSRPYSNCCSNRDDSSSSPTHAVKSAPTSPWCDGPVSTHIVDLSRDALHGRMAEALAIYVAAMGYPRGTEQHRAPVWAEHSLRVGWHAVAALGDSVDTLGMDDAPLLGIAYGYRGARGQWWHEEVRSGLLARARPTSAAESLLDEYFELTELHVLPSAQGLGLGEQLLLRLLTNRPEPAVLLSTPEAPQEQNRAWKLYRRLGFDDVLRHFHFTGDARPFAVLGRALPL